jgi:hypothetical protein
VSKGEELRLISRRWEGHYRHQNPWLVSVE